MLKKNVYSLFSLRNFNHESFLIKTKARIAPYCAHGNTNIHTHRQIEYTCICREMSQDMC